MKDFFAAIKSVGISKQNQLIAMLLAILGFGTACEKITNGADEYGCPSADFILNGNIKDRVAGTPITNIRVIMQRDTAFTDVNGKFVVKVSEFPREQTFDMKITDVDGTANGEYIDKDTTITFPATNFKNGSGSWYKGEEQQSVTISLEPKTK